MIWNLPQTLPRWSKSLDRVKIPTWSHTDSVLFKKTCQWYDSWWLSAILIDHSLARESSHSLPLMLIKTNTDIRRWEMCGEIETLEHLSLDEMSPLINSLPSCLWEPYKGRSRKFVASGGKRWRILIWTTSYISVNTLLRWCYEETNHKRIREFFWF